MIKLQKSSFFNEVETKRRLCEFITGAEILSMGSECKKFEENFAKTQERKFAVFVTSGSAANLILIQSMLNLAKLKKGDKVGVSALTWATNVMPIIQLGLVPVAIDCEISTLNISSRTLEPHLKNIQGLFITNALGFCDDIKTIQKLCEDDNIMFLEDNCESLGSTASGKLLGNFGLASTFSFFVGHHFSTIEGGMICTDDEALHNELLLCRAHGWDRNLSLKDQKSLRETNDMDPFFGKFTFYDLAYNVRPTEINGFLGNEQLGFWDEMVAKRSDNFNKFQDAKKDNSDIFLINTSQMEIVSNFAMPLVFKNHELFLDYKKRFEGAGVEIRPIIAGNITDQPFWKKHVGGESNCENAQFVHENGFYFPNNVELTNGEVTTLSSLISTASKKV
jgi:CDP-6-deoxy-D-xylo-4-hexulose-3-dehydrase